MKYGLVHTWPVDVEDVVDEVVVGAGVVVVDVVVVDGVVVVVVDAGVVVVVVAEGDVVVVVGALDVALVVVVVGAVVVVALVVALVVVVAVVVVCGQAFAPLPRHGFGEAGAGPAAEDDWANANPATPSVRTSKTAISPDRRIVSMVTYPFFTLRRGTLASIGPGLAIRRIT